MANDDCVVYLQAKIIGSGKDHLSTLGFMDPEDIRNKILLSKFTKEETRIAIDEVCTLGLLDLYYKVPCSNCGQDSYILEKDFVEKSKASEITQVGFCCRHCQNFEKAGRPLEKVYAINQSYLGGFEGSDPYSVSPLKRFFTSILRRIKGNNG